MPKGYSLAEAAEQFGGRGDFRRRLHPTRGLAAWGKTSPDGSTFLPIAGILSWLGPVVRDGTDADVRSNIFDEISNTIRDPNTGTTWFGVRILPEIESPDLPQRVDGHKLEDVIERYISNGVSLQKLESYCRNQSINVIMLFPFGGYVEEKQDIFIDLPVSEGIQLYRARCILEENGIHGDAWTAATRYAKAFWKEVLRLFHLLETGKIGADGVDPRTKTRIPVDLRSWARDGFAFELRRGDLVDRERGEIEFRDICLRNPTPAIAAKVALDRPPAPLGAPGGRKEEHAYLAALDRLFASGFHVSDVHSGAEFARRLGEIFEPCGYERPAEDRTIERWIEKRMPHLWARVTGRE